MERVGLRTIHDSNRDNLSFIEKVSIRLQHSHGLYCLMSEIMYYFSKSLLFTADIYSAI
jgi:hypothetical protein